jgi:hypothetical protein
VASVSAFGTEDCGFESQPGCKDYVHCNSVVCDLHNVHCFVSLWKKYFFVPDYLNVLEMNLALVQLFESDSYI